MIRIFTDGSNVWNGKPHSYGGYGYVIENNGTIVYEDGCSMPVNEKQPVTNNRAELSAIVEALYLSSSMFSNDVIELYSDSQWCVKCANKEWALKKNLDLWMQYNKAVSRCKKKGLSVSINWVKGHIGIELNERADDLAGYYCKLAKPV